MVEEAAKQARTTKHPWFVACDDNMDPADFRRSVRFKGRCLFIKRQDKELPLADPRAQKAS